jgi:hypothetical protein
MPSPRRLRFPGRDLGARECERVPMVGWPAKSSSPPGGEDTDAESVPRLRGKTNVLSEKFISRAMSCISSAVRPAGARNTASWFPVSTWSVNTSRCR